MTQTYALDPLKVKLAAGIEDCAIFGIGDSTLYGSIDTGWADNYGWFGRFGKLIGEYYRYNVDIYGYNTSTNVWEQPQFWSVGQVTGPSKIRIYTAPGSGRPTLKLYHGGFPGYTIAALSNVISGYANFRAKMAEADVVLVADWLNDYTQNINNLASAFQSFVTTRVRPYAPNATVIITTENPSNRGYGPTGVANAIPRAFLSGITSLPLVPGVIAGASSWPNLFVADTQQGYLANYTTSGQLNPDLVHPTAAGYAAQATWMFHNLVVDPSAVPKIVTADLGSIIRGVYYELTLEATGEVDSWSVVSGAVPRGITFSTSTHTLSGTPTAFGADYDLTIGVVGPYGSDEKRYTGIVASNGFPFAPVTVSRHRFKALGTWYAASCKLKRSNGSWVPTRSRN
ncbi:hypothetical protein FHT44_005137 [Mycolicibacterium sp. BK634]|uniref:putative Ig domain-containing protein n=1 Tax=Mycolicibacterium sp. BK634 TaxID=2587099 RepID=UPI00160D6A8E|nr:putative Ig domain-containing protein [Mycolicibacterium sp. BK634]MBB3752625.1 hypothetical protein [Mycolicibacterium sp. BK634]